MNTKMDTLETKIDMNFKEFDIKIDKINSDIKFIPLLNAVVLIGGMMVLAYAFWALQEVIIRGHSSWEATPLSQAFGGWWI